MGRGVGSGVGLGVRVDVYEELKFLGNFTKIKAVFSEENYVPQPSSFVGYIENYGIKLWRPFKQ